MKALSIVEVSERLGISEESVLKLIEEGKIIAIEMGGFGIAKKFLVSDEEVKKKEKGRKIVPCPVAKESSGDEWITFTMVMDKKSQSFKFRKFIARPGDRTVGDIIDLFPMLDKVDFDDYFVADVRGNVIKKETSLDSISMSRYLDKDGYVHEEALIIFRGGKKDEGTKGEDIILP